MFSLQPCKNKIIILFLSLDTEVEFGENCNPAQFDCKWAGCKDRFSKLCSGSCIPKANVNDGIPDCADGSDEGTSGKILIAIS